MRSFKWAAPAALISAIALSACAGGGTTPSSGAPGMGAPVGASVAQAKHFTVIGIHPNAKCSAKKFPSGCFTFSQGSDPGLQIGWCYGPPSAPCSDTGEVSDWGGTVCAAKNLGCATGIKGITAAFSGPFSCGASCGNGSYELDAISAGRKEPAQTAKYKYTHGVTGCLSSSCGYLAIIGINVGP